MESDLRKECVQHLEYFVGLIQTPITDVLDVGIAGDVKPGGNYYLFSGKNYQTMDKVASLEPSIVSDICDPPKKYWGKFDLVILSNTLEHIFDTRAALQGCYKLMRRGGYLIVDCPWKYTYHKSASSDDYWRMSAPALTRLLEESGFEQVNAKQGDFITTALGRKL